MRLINPRLLPVREKGNFSSKKTLLSHNFIYMACCTARASKIYSNSVNNNIITAYCFNDQDTGTLFIKKTYSKVKQCVSTYSTQSISTYLNGFIPSPAFFLYHNLAKWLSHYFILLSFLFLFGLTTQRRSIEKSHMSGYYNVMSHDDVT